MLKGEVEARGNAFCETLSDGSGEKIEGLISEVLDVEFTRSVSGEFRGFELVLCLGGHNVYLSYRVSQSEAFVKWFWGGDSVEISLGGCGV